MKVHISTLIFMAFLIFFGFNNVAGNASDYNNFNSLPPLSSVIHVLPPLVKKIPKLSNFDQTLINLIDVKICQLNGDKCIPEYVFTSENNESGLSYIKLKKGFYHVNWNISKKDAKNSFKIRFNVAGLDLGETTYTPKTTRTIPIKFHIENHPIIRARVLYELGYSDMEIATALFQEFNLCVSDLAIVLKDASGLTALEVSQLLWDFGFDPIEITIELRDVYNLGAYDAGLVCKELGLNEFTIQSVLIEVYDVYAAIVDIVSTINDEPYPQGYTGLAFCSEETRCTEPYVPGLFGQFVTPSDINKGIGGDFRYVYVKYELVPRVSDQSVVTGIKAAHWPYWHEPFPCGKGWTPVSPLTTSQCPFPPGSIGSCYRIGMCARYEPFKDVEKFVTNAAISYGDFGNPATKCSAVGGANANIWPLYTDTYDIHKGCEDEFWVFFCYNQSQPWPARPTTIEVGDNEKLALLEKHAPRLYIHPSEVFYPSSVEWSFDHLVRYSPNNLDDSFYPSFTLYPNPLHLFPKPDSNYYVHPKYYWDKFSNQEQLNWSPSDWLPYHHGCDGYATENPCDLTEAPVYAFWHKQTIPWGEEMIYVADLTYFFYFPYNRGKQAFDTVWENHLGDWEKTTVRLGWVYDVSAGWELKPIHLFVSAHDFGTSHPWDTIEKVQSDSGHPVVYCAKDGHGIYVTEGTQRYGKIVKAGGLYVKFLYDYTEQGAQWNTWTNVKTFDYDAKKGLGSSIWPRWMSTDYAADCPLNNPGCDPSDPASGPICRWGTYKFGCESIPFTGISLPCRMTYGPTGPADKGIWEDPYEP